MTINEMFDDVLVRSGQYLLDVKGVELDSDKFVVIVRSAVATYSKLVPFVKRIHKDLQGTRQFTFSEENTIEGIPDYITEAQPIFLTGIMPFISQPSKFFDIDLEQKKPSPFLYRKPTLTVTTNARYDLECVFKHRVTPLKVDDKDTFEVKSIDADTDSFLELLTSKFLRIIAYSRRAFTLNDLPIVTDADSLVSEAEAMEDKALEKIQETDMKFWIAWR